MQPHRFLREWAVWQALGFVLIALWPSYRWFGDAVWAIPVEGRAQIIGHAAVFLLAVVVLALRSWWRGRLEPGTVALVTLASLGIGYLTLLLDRGAPYSTSVLIAVSVLTLLWIPVPLLISRLPQGGVRALIYAGGAVAVASLVLWSRQAYGGPASAERTERTVYYDLAVAEHSRMTTPSLKPAGAIDRFGDGYLLVTGDGVFHRLRFDGYVPHVRALALRAPLDAAAYDAGAPPRANRQLFRVIDLLVHRGPETSLLVSHHHWDGDRGCVALRVSALRLTGEVDAFPETAVWRTVHDSRPCIPITDRRRFEPFRGQMMGGRMASLADGRVLVTVGNPTEDRWISQDPSADLGKILALDLESGAVEIFSTGHRNPQGLHIDELGTIWSTEHGPRGGDELNRIREGDNFGWPLETHGVEYETPSPAAAEMVPDSLELRAPLYSWVPSIGVSSLLAVRGSAFSKWRGDLLVGSLKAGTLYRVRMEDQRVAYVETISIGERIRDIVEGPDGRIVIWTDRDRLISLTPRPATPGSLLFGQCAACHPVEDGRTHGLGPDLAGIYGRRIAGAPGFEYSDALQDWNGRWTARELDRYLADPALVVPGGTMESEGVADSVVRTDLIEYLRTLR